MTDLFQLVIVNLNSLNCGENRNKNEAEFFFASILSLLVAIMLAYDHLLTGIDEVCDILKMCTVKICHHNGLRLS